MKLREVFCVFASLVVVAVLPAYAGAADDLVAIEKVTIANNKIEGDVITVAGGGGSFGGLSISVGDREASTTIQGVNVRRGSVREVTITGNEVKKTVVNVGANVVLQGVAQR